MGYIGYLPNTCSFPFPENPKIPRVEGVGGNINDQKQSKNTDIQSLMQVKEYRIKRTAVNVQECQESSPK